MFIVLLLIVIGFIYLSRQAERNGTPLFGEGWFAPGACPECQGHPHHQGPSHGAPEDEAMRTLANRLASGDITPEDYRERLAALRTTRAQAYDPTAGMPYLGPEDTAGH
ncbi:hypothetical protein GA0111570_10719 [Raineyella antarctica]|uniref:Short C-terminal domain-containing protein n=1 Tax=Raineyella antarctica TaxID=1577474 RepID=A0A1G6H6C3_9ACTN|nr:SHOCT domain-containing protein [Raineyella antarctica]SDB89772.1 hypothetical protein GA0111570_10719 [Raineyella antarctica]